jgi:hypothetical protein
MHEVMRTQAIPNFDNFFRGGRLAFSRRSVCINVLHRPSVESCILFLHVEIISLFPQCFTLQITSRRSAKTDSSFLFRHQIRLAWKA